jgi:hypothetical protein
MLSSFLFTCLSLWLLPTAHATIYFANETLPSLPALFGRYMNDNKVYNARLQFLPENPYLCDNFDSNATSFIEPKAIRISNTTVLPADAVVMLASRGNCPFARKAAVAESMGAAVKFLIVYNYELDGEDTLMPMFTEYGDSRLVLLSVTHHAGRSLRSYLASQPKEILSQGGPVIRMDSKPPPGLITTADLQEMMVTTLGLFFMLISLSACAMILMGARGHVQADGRIVFNAAGAKLTEEQVLALPQPTERAVVEQCAICFDDDQSTPWTYLPCQHQYHTECIVPWLTERQPMCPLCKYDVLEHIIETERANGTIISRNVLHYLWTRLTRYRWTQVSVVSPDSNTLEHDHNGEDVAVEMTEQQIPPQMQ